LQQLERGDLVKVLMDDPSEVNRSKAHAQLGRLALDADNMPKALLHFHEAVDLDPTDEVTREVLRGLELPRAGQSSLFGKLWPWGKRASA